MKRRALLRMAAALALLATCGPAVAKVRQGPSGDAFYNPPARLPGHAHGDVVWVHEAPPAAQFVNASVNELVLYRSESLNGKADAVSGAIEIPKQRAPHGGFPVISWGHGAVGIADRCAPSHGRAGDATPLIDGWLARGYAVVRTDYEGLGTPGIHPYQIGVSEGRGVLDIIRAARQFDPRIGRRVVLAGHSEGGLGTLWASVLAHKWTPELTVLGAVAEAPVSHGSEQGAVIQDLHQPGGGISATIALVLGGLDVTFPELDITHRLTDRALALWPQLSQRCVDDLARPDSFGGLAPADFFPSGADISDGLRRLDQSDPENLSIRVPLLITQGTADSTVFKPLTDMLVDELRKHGATVKYKTYGGIEHNPLLTASARDVNRWIAARLRR